MAALQQALSPRYTLVFANAPEVGGLWIRDPPNGKAVATTDANWAAASVTYLDGLVRSQGPFYGILGYSQGAAMSIYYLSRAALVRGKALLEPLLQRLTRRS